jgi:hypothetical protein
MAIIEHKIAMAVAHHIVASCGFHSSQIARPDSDQLFR